MAPDGVSRPQVHADSLFSYLSANCLSDVGDIRHGDMSFGRCELLCSGMGQGLPVAQDVPGPFLVS